MTRLEQLRLDAGLTIQQLADKADVPRSAVYRIESGKGRISPDRLAKLGSALDARPSELYLPAAFSTEKVA